MLSWKVSGEGIPCRADSPRGNTEVRVDGHVVVIERLQGMTGPSWDLTFMQNQIEKGKVTMMKSRDVRTRSHSQAPNPEDLVP